MTSHISTHNPIIDGRAGIRVSKVGHRILRYARKNARSWEARGYRAVVVRDKVTNRYFVFKSKVRNW